MKLKIFASCLVLVMLVTPLAAFPAQPALSASVAQQVRSLGMFQTPKFNAHYRTPNVDQIESLIEQKGIPLPGPDAKNQAVQAFRQEWALRNPTTPNPEKLQALMDKERQGKLGLKPAAADDTQIMSLAIPVAHIPHLGGGIIGN